MFNNNWFNELEASITVCDTAGIILFMNQLAIKTFEKYGGEQLIGENLLDCHPEPAKSKLKELLITQKTNIYTIEKNGIRKIIIQKPWYENGNYQGLVEIATEIPIDMPNFSR